MTSVMYFGGLEGGATHSNLVICDSAGEVVGRAKGPGTNHWHMGIEECVTRILAMLHQAKKEANIPINQPIDSLGLTMSGCEQSSTNRDIEVRVKERDDASACQVHVASDTVGSLFTGAPDTGIVLIAGTGSNALLRTADGTQFGCGGWGHLLGDEGAAYWIAHKAVKAVFDDLDGLRIPPHPTDSVWKLIKEHFNVETRNDLLEHAYASFEKPKFAAITGKLASLAVGGDKLARWLFVEAGRALADHVAALTARLPQKAPRDKPMRVVCVGSVWHSWRLLQPGFLDQLRRRNVNLDLELVRLKVSSALGAAGLAAKMVGYNLPRDDGEYCTVFYTYRPGDDNLHSFGDNDNGIGNSDNGIGTGDNGIDNSDNGIGNGSDNISNGLCNSDNDIINSNEHTNGKFIGSENGDLALGH